MATSTNSVSGLSTGFDWASMVEQLIAIDHQRVDLVEAKKSKYEAQLSAWQSFNTKLLSLKTACEALKEPEDFYLYSAGLTSDSSTVGASDLVSAATDSTASTGSYTLKITNLAAAQKLSSNPFTSKTTALGSSYAGDILINGRTVTVSATDSLVDAAYSINSLNAGSNPTGVTATVVNYGTNDYRLVLTSDETGEDGISLLNGSSVDLVQRFGWKDSEATIKNAITLGAQSDRFSSAGTSVQSLLGCATGETGTVTIGDKTVEIKLGTMSLTDIKTAINGAAPTGVTASVVSETEGGTTRYRLQIDGTQTFADAKNILNTLGILDHGSAAVSGVASGNAMTEDGVSITAATVLKNIDGYNTFTSGGYPAGDYIALTGFDTDNGAVSAQFSIGSSSTVQDLLDEIETQFGDVLAYVTSDGKIRVDDLGGGGHLVVNLADHIQAPGSQLEFVDADANFGAASERQREVVAGEDAVIEIDGVAVTRSGNTIDDVITGVTLNLLKEDASTTVTLKISHDSSAVKSKIEGLVSTYNSVMSYINTQFSYDEDSEETGGALFGDGTLSSIKSQLLSQITNAVWGVSSSFSILAMAGIRLDSDVLMNVDDTKLDNCLRTNFNDVLALFTGQGTTSSSILSYITHSRDTEAGEYDVHISRAATRGAETGNVDLSAGGAAEALTVTQGGASASVEITNDMTIEDIVNACNTEFDAVYTQTLVGDQALKEDDNVTAVSAETAWDNIFGTTLEDGDTITFSGTNRSGAAVSGSYTISDAATDTIQDLLSEIEDAFSSTVTAAIDTSGRIVLTDLYSGTSRIALALTGPPGKGLDFGTVDVTEGAGDGSQTGRYALSLTAGDDGSGHLVIQNDDYGSASFSISQDTSDGNYDHILYTESANTTTASGGTVFVTASTTWSGVYGAAVTDGETISISGKARNGSADISGTYTITDKTADTLDGLLTAIEAAYSAQGTAVNAFLRDGAVYVEDTAPGSSAIALTLTYNGTGSLGLGTFGDTTQRDLDLGLIDGTWSGLDAAGTIDGESATGSGQILTSDSGNANTAGLSVKYSGTADDTNAGTVRLTLGFAALLERVLYGITDPLEGYEAYKEESLQNTIDSLDTQIEQMEAYLERKQESMTNRFVAMELALSEIQSQSDWLTSMLDSMSG